MLMNRYSTKHFIFDIVDFHFWQMKIEAYIRAQGFVTWEKFYKLYRVPKDIRCDDTIPHVEPNIKATRRETIL